MFQRFHEMKERRESGFTLIELLVVILIIAILAAIAIPVFLNQRRKGWISQLESALKNAATSQESCLTDQACNGGDYADTLAQLTGQGFRYSNTDVTFAVVSATEGLDYCMSATSTHDTSLIRYYDSAEGKPSTTVCT